MSWVKQLVEVEILKDSTRLLLVLMRFNVLVLPWLLLLLSSLVLIRTDSFPDETVLVLGIVEL